MSGIPTAALALGWAGVIPFAGLSLVTIVASGDAADTALRALVAYGAIILSFMGGVQWGLEMVRSDASRGPRTTGLAASVLPALAAFGAVLFAPLIALAILAVGFAGLLAYDLKRVREGIAPAWYAPLRWQLTTAVVLSLGAAVAAG